MILLEKLIFQAREQLTELPESVMLSRESLRALVPPAIALWQERTNGNLQKRQNFIRESGDIAVVDGVCDIAEVIDQFGFRLEFIRESDIEIEYPGTPAFQVKFVNSLDRLKMVGRQDKFFTLCYLSGTKMTFRYAGDAYIDSLNVSFKIRSVVFPTDLTDMNEALLPELSLVLAELAGNQLKEQNRGLNIPPKS